MSMPESGPWGPLSADQITAKGVDISGALGALGATFGRALHAVAPAAQQYASDAASASPSVLLGELAAFQDEIDERMQALRAMLTAVAYDATADPFATTGEFRAFVEDGEEQ